MPRLIARSYRDHPADFSSAPALLLAAPWPSLGSSLIYKEMRVVLVLWADADDAVAALNVTL